MKNFLLVGIIILFLSSCGQVETARISTDVPKFIATEIPTDTPAPVLTSSPVVIKPTPTIILATGLAPEKFSEYIGLNYPPLPDSLSQSFGMVIWDPNDYGLSLVSQGENRMLWLDKLTHHDSSGKAYWEVKDILEVPNVDGDVALIPDGCLLNGESDYEIIAIGKWDDEVFSSRYISNEKILMAWRANTSLEIFEVIPTNGVECHADTGILLK